MIGLLGQDERFLTFYFVLFTLCFIGIGISWIEICKGWRNRDKQFRRDFQGVLGEWQGFIGQNGKNGFKGGFCKPGGILGDELGRNGSGMDKGKNRDEQPEGISWGFQEFSGWLQGGMVKMDLKGDFESLEGYWGIFMEYG